MTDEAIVGSNLVVAFALATTTKPFNFTVHLYSITLTSYDASQRARFDTLSRVKHVPLDALGVIINDALFLIACIIQAMKPKILKALPIVFSLRPNSDYSRFVVHGGAGKMMSDTWVGVGQRLNEAMHKVGRDAEKQKIRK